MRFAEKMLHNSGVFCTARSQSETHRGHCLNPCRCSCRPHRCHRPHSSSWAPHPPSAGRPPPCPHPPSYPAPPCPSPPRCDPPSPCPLLSRVRLSPAESFSFASGKHYILSLSQIWSGHHAHTPCVAMHIQRADLARCLQPQCIGLGRWHGMVDVMSSSFRGHSPWHGNQTASCQETDIC